jgi:hypothetical protein
MQCVILYDTELCLELDISIEIKYKKYKIYLEYIKNILYKYIDFVLKVLKVLKYVLKVLKVLKDVLKLLKIMYAEFESYSAQCSVTLHRYVVRGSMLLSVRM